MFDINNIKDEKIRGFYELFCRRSSIRQFQDREIEAEKLDRILEIGRRAPSASNLQPWHFIILSKDKRREFDEVINRKSLNTAPVIIAACVEPNKAWVRSYDKKNYAWVDVTIALTEMMAAATAEGLGSCWIAAFDPFKAREILNLPQNIELVILIALGYPEKPLSIEEKERKNLKNIIHYEKWGN
jgi:nitroreductase